MKAAVVTRLGEPLVVCEEPLPQPGRNQILVKIEATGVCHTDLHAAQGDWPVKPVVPFIPGHEGVGRVAAVGAAVKAVQEGDRVGVPWLHTACGHCEYCISAWETLCGSQLNTGYSINGTYAEYVLADPDYVARIPASLDSKAAAPILCAGVTVYKGLKTLECRAGEWVVVSGVGGLGHMAIQYAKAMGFHVAAVDIAPDKLRLAASLGADITIDATQIDPISEVQKRIGGAHGVLVTAVSTAAFSQGLGLLRKRGTMSMVGIPPGEFSLPIFDVVLNAKTVRGSIVGTRKDLQECLEFAEEGKVRAQFSADVLENINDVFTRMKRNEIDGRVVVSL
jgi:propanol-preferring alcohol dehydrogenase